MLRKDRFDEREEDFYEALYTQSQAQFDSYVQTSTVLNNYAHVFSLLVRLRQVLQPCTPTKLHSGKISRRSQASRKSVHSPSRSGNHCSAVMHKSVAATTKNCFLFEPPSQYSGMIQECSLSKEQRSGSDLPWGHVWEEARSPLPC